MQSPTTQPAFGPAAFGPDLTPETLLVMAHNASSEEVEESFDGFAYDLAEIRALPEAEHGPKREFPKLWDKPTTTGLDALLSGMPLARELGHRAEDKPKPAPDEKEETT